MTDLGERHREPRFAEALKDWRHRRRLSQMELAGEAGLSTRHLSFLETGRSQPSRAMVLRLADELGLPLREQNRLLVAAGYAPVHPARSLDDPALGAARAAVRRIVEAHMPYPALAIDRHWTLLEANAAVATLLDGVDAALLAPPANVLRIALSPSGLAPRIVNFASWRAYLLRRLAHEVDLTGDSRLADLLGELEALPRPVIRPPISDDGLAGIAVALRLRHGTATLAFLSTTTVFGGPADVTLSEIAIEAFFPADAETAACMRALAGA